MSKEHFPLSIEEVGPDMGDEQVTVNRDPAKVVGSPNSTRMKRPCLTCNAPCSPTAVTLPTCEYRYWP